MSTTIERMVLSAALGCVFSHASVVFAQSQTFNFGTAPSQAEFARFVSPLPDGRGLPAGSGSVAQGKVMYEQQCITCHGVRLAGGIGDRLIGGRATLVNNDPTKAPMKTVESYWPYSTTPFDYIKRAMPLTAPDSLTNDQIYALVAYILAEAKIVPNDTIADAKTLATITMPNRDGFIPDSRAETFPSVADTSHQDLKMATPAK